MHLLTFSEMLYFSNLKVVFHIKCLNYSFYKNSKVDITEEKDFCIIYVMDTILTLNSVS